MWTLKYTQEAQSYFIDNDPYTFQVLVKCEELKHYHGGIPETGCTQIDDGLLWWEVLDQAVIFERIEAKQQIIIVAIKPI
ncbi:hypothetical protein BH10CHL1_BH10CHL1_47850 [soil metagenome]